MLTLADLDRDELLALAERFIPTLGIDLLQARFDAALRRQQTAYAQWKKASGLAVADAQAAKRRFENHGFDDAWRSLFEVSKRSTRTASEFWREYELASRRLEQISRELKRHRASEDARSNERANGATPNERASA